jgi:superoxide dismutase, Cu-Zn family
MHRKLLLSTAFVLTLSAPVLAQDMGTADFIDVEGNALGTLEIMDMDGGVHVMGDLTGLPEGEHGIHFHQVGECDYSGQFETAGDHFNPADRQHGLENPEGAHAGDLENITVAADGTVSVMLMSDLVSLAQDSDGYLFDEDGTALVIHAEADDQMTDPSGNSGDRIACAIISNGAAAQ